MTNNAIVCYDCGIMSGHSKWSTIKHQKGVKDARRGKIFSKLAMQIALGAKAGADLSMNPALRLVVAEAKRAGMPKDNIDRAILRGSGKAGGAELKEAVYEAYGVSGAAMVIKTITDNSNRILAEIRGVLNKYGGKLAGQGAVAYQFSQMGEIAIGKNLVSNKDELELELIDQGLEDWIDADDRFIVHTQAENLTRIAKFLAEHKIEPLAQKIILKPANFLELSDDLVKKNQVILEKLEELDDVQEVFVNF